MWKERGEEKTEKEIEDWRLETLADLESGRLFFEASQDHEAGAIFFVGDQVLPVITEKMTWFSLRASPGSTFICSDHPLHIYDENAAPGAGVGWVSSPTTEVTMPIDERVCLLLRPGPPTWELRTVDAPTVQEINLRTYASAQWSIYGPSQAASAAELTGNLTGDRPSWSHQGGGQHGQATTRFRGRFSPVRRALGGPDSYSGRRSSLGLRSHPGGRDSVTR